jgi:hypothetical protein
MSEHFSGRAGHMQVRLFTVAEEHRIDLRSSWGTGFNIGVRHLPDIVAALREAERAARRAGLLTTDGDA